MRIFVLWTIDCAHFAEFDALTGSKISSIDIGARVVRMLYSPTSGHAVVSILEVGTQFYFSLSDLFLQCLLAFDLVLQNLDTLGFHTDNSQDDWRLEFSYLCLV